MWHEEGETTWLDEATRTYWQVDGELGQAGVWPARFHHRLAGESVFHSPAYGGKTAALATLAGLGGAWVDAWKTSEDGFPCATAEGGPAGGRGDNIKVRLVAEGPNAEEFSIPYLKFTKLGSAASPVSTRTTLTKDGGILEAGGEPVVLSPEWPLDPNQQSAEVLVITPTEFVELAEDGSLLPVAKPVMSDPAPTVHITALEVQIDQVDRSTDSPGITVSVSAQGTIDDELSDVSPGDEKVVNILTLYVNEDWEHPIKVPVTTTKLAGTTLSRKQYDFTGQFSFQADGISVVEGNNTLRFEALSWYGKTGYSLHHFMVSGTGNTIPPSLTADFTGALSQTVVDTVHLTSAPLGIDEELQEQAPEVETFRPAAAVSTRITEFAILQGPSLWDSGNVDEFTAQGTFAGGGTFTGHFTESAPSSLFFEGTDLQSDNSYAFITFEVTDLGLIEESKPGPFQPILMRLRGLGDFLGESEGEVSISAEFPDTMAPHYREESSPGLDQWVAPPVVEWVEEEGGSRPFIEHQGEVYLGNAQGSQPGVIVLGLTNQGVQISLDLDLERYKKRLNSGSTFAEGFANALPYAGLSFVEGGVALANTIKSGAKGAWNFVFHTSFGDKVKAVKGGVTGLMGFHLDALLTATDFERLWQAFETNDTAYLISWQASVGDALSPGLGTVSTGLCKMLYNTFEEAVKTYKTGTPGEKGLLTGVIVTEIIAAAMGVAELRQAAKLAKAGQMTRTMEKLIERPVMQAPARQTLCSRLRDKLKAFREWIDPWCFVAGTLVATPAGAVPIESVRAGDLVWSRDPGTFLTEPRPVRETYVSHPAELFHVGVDRDGDHRADETISGTGSHPWYVLTPGRAGFVPARELQAGDILSLRDGTRAWVADKTREVAPPGQTFTTYNFAVADHHTYFAGEGGVWVHNLCKKLKDEYVGHHDVLFKKHLDEGKDLQNAWDDAIEELLESARLTDGRIDDDSLEQLAMILIGETPTDWGVRLKFGQKRIAPNFRKVSPGHPDILGKPIAEVAEMLKTGALSADDIPIYYFVRNGEAIAVNNRGLAALTMAGKKVSKMERVDPRPEWLARLDELPIDNWHEVPGNRIAVTEFRDGSGHIYSIFKD